MSAGLMHTGRTLPDGSTAVYVWFEAMHTRVDMLLKSHDASSYRLLEVAEDARVLIAEIERAGNHFDSESEISRLVASPAGKPVRISAVLCDMLRLSLDYNLSTGGLFDITVNTPGHRPETIKAVELNVAESTCILHTAGMVLDLSGFIKGYALDRIRELLKSRGIADALVSLGNSSIMAMGDVPGPVKDCCLTTSGNATADRRHILNPLTGEYAEGEGSAQVTTTSGAEGEVMATVEFIRSRLKRE